MNRDLDRRFQRLLRITSGKSHAAEPHGVPKGDFAYALPFQTLKTRQEICHEEALEHDFLDDLENPVSWWI